MLSIMLIIMLSIMLIIMLSMLGVLSIMLIMLISNVLIRTSIMISLPLGVVWVSRGVFGPDRPSKRNWRDARCWRVRCVFDAAGAPE